MVDVPFGSVCMESKEIEVLRKKLRREEQKVALLESLIETKTREVFSERERYKSLSDQFAGILETVPNPLFVIDDELDIQMVNSATLKLLVSTREALVGAPLNKFLSMREISRIMGSRRTETGVVIGVETNICTTENKLIPILVSLSSSRDEHTGREQNILVALDVSERKALETQLLQSQKLESVGQLAAGIAHELNTPIQYIRDNMTFLSKEFVQISSVVTKALAVCSQVKEGSCDPDSAFDALKNAQTCDLEYLLTEIPSAVKETLNGAESVANIVKAMKEFSHPGSSEIVEVDLNAAIQSVTNIARNEWKYVAELLLDLEPNLPLVPCYAGELNQAILNIVVNAAHAIADGMNDHGKERGVLTVATRVCNDEVCILVSDTGTGIPEAVQGRIFEPFFTTKEVGRGTGQGLSIAYATIVKKHGGSLTFRTRMGAGTTFIISLKRKLEPVN